MTIQRLFRTRLIVCTVVAASAAAIGIAGLASDAIFFLPAGMMAAAAAIGFHLAWTSYRFDRGLSGPPEWRDLVRDAAAATTAEAGPQDEPPAAGPPTEKTSPDRP